jgi:hypothetical protein
MVNLAQDQLNALQKNARLTMFARTLPSILDTKALDSARRRRLSSGNCELTPKV